MYRNIHPNSFLVEETDGSLSVPDLLSMVDE